MIWKILEEKGAAIFAMGCVTALAWRGIIGGEVALAAIAGAVGVATTGGLAAMRGGQ